MKTSFRAYISVLVSKHHIYSNTVTCYLFLNNSEFEEGHPTSATYIFTQGGGEVQDFALKQE